MEIFIFGRTEGQTDRQTDGQTDMSFNNIDTAFISSFKGFKWYKNNTLLI